MRFLPKKQHTPQSVPRPLEQSASWAQAVANPLGTIHSGHHNQSYPRTTQHDGKLVAFHVILSNGVRGFAVFPGTLSLEGRAAWVLVESTGSEPVPHSMIVAWRSTLKK